MAPVWTLDSVVNGDLDVLLQASICDAAGQCGSGHGDLEMLIQVSLFANVSLDDYLVFYTEYDLAARPNGGFEEWSTRSGTVPIPEPSAAIVFAVGMVLISPRLYRGRN